MLRLRTKMPKTVPCERGTKSVIVHLIIDELNQNRNNIVGIGYYYYYDENNQVVELSKIRSDMEVALFEMIENNMLGALESDHNAVHNVKQRLREMTLMNVDQENGESYGIVREDLIDDV